MRRMFVTAFLLGFFQIAGLSAEPREIRLGFVTDTTGFGAFFGTQSVRGAELAQSEIVGRGGKLKLIFEDTGGSSPEAAVAVARLIDVEQVDGVICDLTPICTAIAPKVKRAGKVLIYHSPSETIKIADHRAFRNFLDYRKACAQVARHWKLSGHRQIAALMPNLEFADLCLEGVLQVEPNPIAIRYNSGDDLRSYVALFREKGVTAVMHVGYEADFMSWMKHCQSQEFRPTQGMVEIMLSDNLIGAARWSLEGATLAGYEDIPEDFATRLTRFAPSASGSPNLQGAALSYNSVEALYDAASKCPSAAEGECVAAALRKKSAPGLLGFEWWGERSVEYPIVLKRWEGGKISRITKENIG